MMRLLAIVEGLFLFAAAATYGSGSLGIGFIRMLGAYHWTTFALIGVFAAAAVACIVIAVQLLIKPHQNLMIAGLLFLMPAVIISSKLVKI